MPPPEDSLSSSETELKSTNSESKPQSKTSSRSTSVDLEPHPESLVEFSKPTSVFNMGALKAILKKNSIIQKRSPLANCCILITPLIIISALGIGVILINNANPPDGKAKLNEWSYYPLNNEFPTQFPLTFSNFIQWSLAYGPTCNSTCKASFGEITKNNVTSGILADMIQGTYTFLPSSVPFGGGKPDGYPDSVPIPFFTGYFNDSQSQLDFFAETISLLQDKTPGEIIASPNFLYSLPTAAFVVDEADPTTADLKMRVLSLDQSRGYSQTGRDIPSANNQNRANLQRTRAFLLVFRAFMKNLVTTSSPAASGSSYINYFNNSNIGMTGLEWEEPQDATALIDFATVLVIPFSLSFLLPLFVNQLVAEKEARVREFSKNMGLPDRVFYLFTYCFQMVLYMGVCLFLIIGLSAWQSRVFTQTPFAVWFPLYFGWGLAQSSFAFFFSTFFDKSRPATFSTLIVVFITVLTVFVLNLSTYPFNGENKPGEWMYIFALMSFCRGVYIMWFTCDDLQCLTVDKAYAIDEWSSILLSLYLSAIFFMILAIYLDQVLPRQYGVPRDPFFIFDIFRTKPKFQIEKESDSLRDSDVQATEDFINGLDIDNTPNDQLPALIVTHIHKTYPGSQSSPPHHAVRGLSFYVEKGRIFALLGPNGAGKSTTINMMIGMTTISHGDAIYSGEYSVETNLDLVHKHLGVCPQHDIFWNNLTVWEQLAFFSQLKGVPSAELASHVQYLCDAVCLNGKENARISELSGGMRRRVSIAQAFAGNPSVVLIDEATTGVDPVSRQHISRFISSQKAGRAILMTTHNLEEADELADVIAIMSDGRLRAIGESVHLKNKFAKGFSLQLTYPTSTENVVLTPISELPSLDDLIVVPPPPPSEEIPGGTVLPAPIQVESSESVADPESNTQLQVSESDVIANHILKFIASFLPQAILTEHYPGRLEFKMPDVSLGPIFKKMNSESSLHGISAWALEQSSLEQVFLNIVNAQEAS